MLQTRMRRTSSIANNERIDMWYWASEGPVTGIDVRCQLKVGNGKRETWGIVGHLLVREASSHVLDINYSFI